MAMKPKAENAGKSSATAKSANRNRRYSGRQAEGKMQTEAAMYPPRRQQPELHPLQIGRPQVGDDAGIICWLREQFISEAHLGEVIDEDERSVKPIAIRRSSAGGRRKVRRS